MKTAYVPRSRRVLLGGSWTVDWMDSRLGPRDGEAPGARYPEIGLRLIRRTA